MQRITTPDDRKDLIKGRIHHLINEEDIKHIRFFSHVTIEPGDAVDYHKHEGEYEIYYIVSGEGLYNDNGEEIPVSKGAVTYCENGRSHGIKNAGDMPLEFIAAIVVE